MKPIDLFLRCYAEKQDNLWVAVCVDLCLAAQADTPGEAIRKLNHQISDYVTEAFSDECYSKELLSRKAPWQQVLKFNWLRLALRFHFIKKSIARAFESRLPLSPDTSKFA